MVMREGIPYQFDPETGQLQPLNDSSSDGSTAEVEEELEEEETLNSARVIIQAEVHPTSSFASPSAYEPRSQGNQPGDESSTTTALQVHEAATNGTPSPMPGTFALDAPTGSGQPSRDTSQAPQEWSLVVRRPRHQNPSPNSPVFPTGPRDLAREDTGQPSPTTIVQTGNLGGGSSDRGSVTPRAGHTTLGSSSRGASQSPIPRRRDRGKAPMVQQYSDEDDIGIEDLGPDPDPRRRPDQVFSFTYSND
jgi:hypothetical protein